MSIAELDFGSGSGLKDILKIGRYTHGSILTAYTSHKVLHQAVMLTKKIGVAASDLSKYSLLLSLLLSRFKQV
nr:hypothetical protein [Tanacetum cinerariifolium]